MLAARDAHVQTLAGRIMRQRQFVQSKASARSRFIERIDALLFEKDVERAGVRAKDELRVIGQRRGQRHAIPELELRVFVDVFRPRQCVGGRCRLRLGVEVLPAAAKVGDGKEQNGDAQHHDAIIIASMLNYIWFGLMAIALVVAAFNGTADAVSKAAIDSAKTAVEISLGLIGVMTLWLGIMRVAEASGLVTLLGRALRPFLRVLFPDVPKDHPANGSIVLSIAANMLGLSNAATPFGIKAMEELQTLNESKDSATNAQVMFMVLNTSGVQLIPATMIGVLAAAGSTMPTAIISTSIVATFIGTVAALISAKLLQRFYPMPAPSVEAAEVSE